MHSFVSRFSRSAADPVGLSLKSVNAVHEDDGQEDVPDELWGSLGGYGSLGTRGGPAFAVPAVPNVSSRICRTLALPAELIACLADRFPPDAY